MKMEKQTSLAKTSERNYGIDLLRIVAMFMVVLLHVLGPGGILFEAKSGTVNFAVAWLLEMVLFCAINCYGLISGYVGITGKYKYSNFVTIWLQVISYNVIISLYYFLRYPHMFSYKTVVNAFFPVCNGAYWYFTAYAGLFVLIPLLNKAVKALKKEQLRAVLVMLFVALCVLPSLFNKDIFLSGWGYSALWLSFLYLTGAYIRQHGFFANRTGVAIGLYAGCVLISWGVKMWEEYVAPSAYWSDLAGGLLTQYSSPTMFLSGVGLFVLFSQIKPPKFLNKIIAFIAPCTFGVYIIHANPLLWDRIITYKYASFINFPFWKMILSAAGVALLLFAVFWIVDYIRSLIFKLLRIKPTLMKIENKLIGDLWN